MALRPAILVFLFFALGKTFAQTACVDSSRVFLLNAGSSLLTTYESIPLADSGILISGTIRDDLQDRPLIFLIRLDKFNNIVFTKKIEGLDAAPRQIIQCNNGDIILTAVSRHNPGGAIFQIPYIIRINLAGNIVWQKQLPATSLLSGEYLALRWTAIAENEDNNIFFGVTDNIGTFIDEDIFFSGYYHVYKIDAAGNVIWKTTLEDNEAGNVHINAIKEVNGKVLVATQQYASSGGVYCNATNRKSIGLIQLAENNGSVILSRNYCLNFSLCALGSVADNRRNSVQVLDDGRIIISDEIYICGHHLSFTILADPDFLNLQAYFFDYAVPNSVMEGSVITNQFGEAILVTKERNGPDYLYAILSPDGNVKMQRKAADFVGRPVFKSPDNFLFFTKLTINGQDHIKISEVKGNSNEMTDCIGRDTNFVTSQPHTLSPITHTWEAVYTGTPVPSNTNYAFTDFSFTREEVCSSVSICDSLKIIGPDTVCLNSPTQLFSVFRNDGCRKSPQWKIDPSVIRSMQVIDDTTVSVEFDHAWEGYLYAFSTSCTELSDSLYIKIVPPPAPVDLGEDAIFCGVVTLDAGPDFLEYLWQDGSTARQFDVTGEGEYHVTATDYCGNVFSDTIWFAPRQSGLFLGNDSCVRFPYTLQAGNHLSSYLWQDGSTGGQFMATGPGAYFVQASNSCGELFTDTIVLHKKIAPFSLGADTAICLPGTLHLSAPTGFSFYHWQDNSAGSNFAVTEAGIYHVVVSDACNASISDTIVVIEKDCRQYFYIPSAFTPNNDGRNDIFKPIISGILESYEFSIYNRWGQRVFHSTDADKGWDGTLGDKPQDGNIFTWVCRYMFKDEPAQLRKGTVMVIR